MDDGRTGTAPPADAARWAGRLLVALATFWGFVLALVISWLVERTDLLSDRAFSWSLRVFTAVFTAATFAVASRFADRVGARRLRPLAVGFGVSLAVGLVFLVIVLVANVGR